MKNATIVEIIFSVLVLEFLPADIVIYFKHCVNESLFIW